MVLTFSLSVFALNLASIHTPVLASPDTVSAPPPPSGVVWGTAAGGMQAGGDLPPPFSYHGCASGTVGADLPWCDQALPHAARLEKLLSLLTLQEKVGLISPNASVAHNTCNMHTAGVPRLGLGQYSELAPSRVPAVCLSPGLPFGDGGPNNNNNSGN